MSSFLIFFEISYPFKQVNLFLIPSKQLWILRVYVESFIFLGACIELLIIIQ